VKLRASLVQLVGDYLLVWVALVSGIASVVLSAVYAVPETPTKVIGFWLSSYLCLIVAAVSLLYKMRQRVQAAEKVAAELQQPEALMEQRRQKGRELLSKADELTMRFLRDVLVEGGMSNDQVAKRYPGLKLYGTEPLDIVLSERGGVWVVDPTWVVVFSELLFAPPAVGPGTVARFVSWLCECSDVIERMVRRSRRPGGATRKDKRRSRKC
jgi:hypothetical protein